MATTPSAFFSDHANPQELSFLVKNMPSGEDFENLVNGTGGGAQVLTGTSGNDIIIVGTGDTVGGGGAGYDVVVTASDFNMIGNIEAVVLRGGSGADVMGNNQDNNIIGNAGGNTLSGKGGDDVISGRTGHDTILGGNGNDTLLGGTGNDNLNGGNNNDFLLGGAGFDELFGGLGNDKLLGGDGRDTLVGGQGTDALWGQGGADTFVIQFRDTGVDKIMDFEKGDIIDLSATSATAFSQLSLTSDGNGNTLVTLKDGTEFKIMGYDPGGITKKMFTF